MTSPNPETRKKVKTRCIIKIPHIPCKLKKN